MKLPTHQLSFLVMLLLLLASCGKEEVTPPPPPLPPSPVPIPPAVNNKSEHFWGLPWNKAGNGYEIKVASNRLTQDAITRGVQVSLAIWTEMTTFSPLPAVFYDHQQKHSVHISYSVKPDTLLVTAKAPFEIVYVSDVAIGYQ